MQGSPYCDAKTRVMVFGKETYGWSWDTNLQSEKWTYPNPWPFRSLTSFSDFLDDPDSVEALSWAYREFNFAEHQGENWRSPFWGAFRMIQERPNTGLLWSNLCKADYDGGSFIECSDPTHRRFIEQQADIIRTEIEILDPHVSIFFTGPYYDYIIESVFPGIAFEQIDEHPTRELARLSHGSLPGRAYRTYHPTYLRRGKRAHLLEALCREAFPDV